MSYELLNDIGHGINTYPPSKGVPGLPEFEFNNAVGQEVKRLLAGKVPTYEAQPFNGRDVPLTRRTYLYNFRYSKNKKAIGISSHANANGKSHVRGFGVFYWHTSENGKKLAEIILDEYKKEFPDREKYPIWGDGLFASEPDEWTDLHMCRETHATFVLVEWEFMTNPEALQLLKSEDYRKRCALVTARSVCRWYGIEEAEVTKEEDDMLENAVVINSFVDFPNAEPLANKLGSPIFTRAVAEGKKVAKNIYVCGGSKDKLVADKIVVLSGVDRYETAKKIGEFLK
jgi:N-acetylmuramoyl-L-alanine amidase